MRLANWLASYGVDEKTRVYVLKSEEKNRVKIVDKHVRVEALGQACILNPQSGRRFDASFSCAVLTPRP